MQSLISTTSIIFAIGISAMRYQLSDISYQLSAIEMVGLDYFNKIFVLKQPILITTTYSLFEKVSFNGAPAVLQRFS